MTYYVLHFSYDVFRVTFFVFDLAIKPDEREKHQDILVNATQWADTRPAALSENIDDAVNYRTICKAIIAHIEQGKPLLVERLVPELAQICSTAMPVCKQSK